MAGPMGGVEPSQAILHTSRALLVIKRKGLGGTSRPANYGPALAFKQPGYPSARIELNRRLRGGRGHSSSGRSTQGQYTTMDITGRRVRGYGLPKLQTLGSKRRSAEAGSGSGGCFPNKGNASAPQRTFPADRP